MQPSLLLEKLVYAVSGNNGQGAKARIKAHRPGSISRIAAINEQQKLLYIVNPKVANTSIKRIIWADHPALDQLPSLHGHHPERSLKELPDRAIDTMLNGDDWFRFSFVRNPYSRIVSAYKDKIFGRDLDGRFLEKIGYGPAARPPSFSEFLHRIADQPPQQMDWHWRPQQLLLMHELIDYHWLGKMEAFESDMTPVFERLGRSNQQMQQQLATRLNATDRDSRNNSNQPRKAVANPTLSNKDVELIQTLYSEDFQRYGYSTEPPENLLIQGPCETPGARSG